MKEQIAIQKILNEKLSEIQVNNPRYSLRAYAQKMEMDPGTLSNIMNGKRNVSIKLAEKISKKLLLDPQERAELLNLFPMKRKKVEVGQFEPRYLELSASQFKIAAEWEHFAIMSLLNCKGFKKSPSWIAKRLGISMIKAEQALKRLLDMGLFTQDKNGNLSRSKKSYRTTDDIANISMKKHHEQSLDLAKESLHRDDVLKRDFTTVTMAIDKTKLASAKELIRKFQDELSDHLECDDQTEVYRLGIQLFPMSKDV